ncbi:MAG: Uma2 family endonuclease [Pyrinomonadaceae bacterium]|nr:Uma2 family endonuclease [Pyrinomonadaceae bacterium]
MSKILEEPLTETAAPDDLPASDELTSQVVLRLRPLVNLSDDDFLELCRLNEGLFFEQNPNGELVIMPPTGSDTGHKNSRLNQQLANWSDLDGTGICFDSSTLFRLPNNAIRSPDAAWVANERWNELTTKQQRGIAPLCPDFVIELRSPTDTIKKLQAKMSEYIENGARLGLLLDRRARRVYLYRPQREMEVFDKPTEVSCSPELPDFKLDLTKIW